MVIDAKNKAKFKFKNSMTSWRFEYLLKNGRIKKKDNGEYCTVTTLPKRYRPHTKTLWILKSLSRNRYYSHAELTSAGLGKSNITNLINNGYLVRFHTKMRQGFRPNV